MFLALIIKKLVKLGNIGLEGLKKTLSQTTYRGKCPLFICKSGAIYPFP